VGWEIEVGFTFLCPPSKKLGYIALHMLASPLVIHQSFGRQTRFQSITLKRLGLGILNLGK
jgi:hypothetical protein